MMYDFDIVKQDFMKVNSGDEWNKLRKKYPDMKLSDMDMEMKEHMNDIIRSASTPEILKNPQTHYETRKK